MKNFIKILLFCLPVFSLSCTEKIDLELDTTYTRLIVFGEVTTDTCSHRVSLHRSADYFSNTMADPVSDALVRISDGKETITLTEDPLAPGEYVTDPDFYGIPGATYRLLIEDVDIDENGSTEIYEAESQMPSLVRMDSIGLAYTKNTFFSGWEVKVWARDPVEERNFYAFRVRKNGIMLTDTLADYQVQSDDFFNGSYTNGITSQFLTDDDPSERAAPGDTIVFELTSIPRDFYVFVLESLAEAFESNPLFSGPPANVTGNISNGALGFFVTSAIDRKSAIVPEEDRP